MVNVGDKVFVAPLYGQKDNLAVITGPAGAAGPGGIIEGDYNTWTKKWLHEFDNGLNSPTYFDALIDEKNDRLSIAWQDQSAYSRFGIYVLSDFSSVFESSRGTDYTEYYPDIQNKVTFHLGLTHLIGGGLTQSIETYLLLLRGDTDTIEVWQGGASALWSTNTQTDSGVSGSKCYVGGISLTGKYILVMVKEGYSPYRRYLMLYEGSKV